MQAVLRLFSVCTGSEGLRTPVQPGPSLMLLLLFLLLLTCPPVAGAPGSGLQWWAHCQTPRCKGTRQHSQRGEHQYSMLLLLLMMV